VYLRFYGLREKPFNPTPDPRFLYLSSAHREALAQLEYGVKERRGFIVLIGEVGTGKTTLLRTLLDRLESTTESAFVFNSMMPFDQILAYVVEDFGIVGAGDSHARRLVALNHYLTDRVRRGLNTVLIIDEAQNLDAASLEQVRMLSNFETTNEKLLQIVLVGQPELKAKLALPELRQLKQRIGLRCAIHPLSPEDTAEYIHHRLTTASQGPAPEIFTQGAVERICAYSRGTPRVVNLVCDHCLLVGYADQKRVIDIEVVEEAIDYLEEREPSAASAPPVPESKPKGTERHSKSTAERHPKGAPERHLKSAPERSPKSTPPLHPKSSPDPLARSPVSPEPEREAIAAREVPENKADALDVAQRFSPERSPESAPPLHPKSSPDPLARSPVSPQRESQAVVGREVPEIRADAFDLAQRFSPEVGEVGPRLLAESVDRWDLLPERSSGRGELSERWLVSAAMAAAVGSAVFLALEPNGALALVGRLASSFENWGAVARDLLGQVMTGSQTAAY
jgi:general secretion pathway protein A